jgi:hypothetical protein
MNKLGWFERLAIRASDLVGRDSPVVLAGDYNEWQPGASFCIPHVTLSTIRFGWLPHFRVQSDKRYCRYLEIRRRLPTTNVTN